MTETLKDHFTRLYRHLAWADARVLESMRSAQNPRKKDLELYSHILGAEHVWLARINGLSPGLAVWPTLSFDECESLGKENVSAFDGLIARMTPELLQKPVPYRNSAGDQFTSTIEDILTHVAMHGSYHRGQIAVALRAGGDTPSPTDYIAFVRGAPTATRQE